MKSNFNIIPIILLVLLLVGTTSKISHGNAYYDDYSYCNFTLRALRKCGKIFKIISHICIVLYHNYWRSKGRHKD